MKNKTNTIGIKGEPKSGVIARSKIDGTYLKWDSNTQFITMHIESGEVYDRMDCSFWNTWEEVKQELLDNYGWEL